MYRERLDFGGRSFRKEVRGRVRSIDGLCVRRGRLQRKRRDRGRIGSSSNRTGRRSDPANLHHHLMRVGDRPGWRNTGRGRLPA